MGSNSSDAVMVSAVDEAECSETTVEIKIKTLDSQTYTLRVNKRVPVPELKEQIQTVTGVVSEQQRLICRGKVLKDDQLLSAYHVEDGHTLHMVVRQPIPPSSTSPMGFSGLENLPDQSGSDPAAGPGQVGGTHVAHRVLLGSFNIADQGEGGIPDLNRIISAVLSSIGIPNMGSSAEGSDPMELGPDRLERASGGSVTADSNQPQPDQHTGRVQFDPLHGAFRIPSTTSLGIQQPPVIPDSVTTLLQYLSHLRHEFTSVGGIQSSINGERGPTTASQSDSGPAGLPTAASLAEVMLSTRQLLIEQVGACLSQLAGQLEDQRNVTSPALRNSIQTSAMRTGISLQNLGTLLLELGRTTMTLRMGQTPSDALVNAGPAVFISTSGPNPIMVQPLQPGAGLGAATPMGMMNAGSGLLGGGLGSGLFPRNIDIRIRAGPSGSVNQGDQAGAQTVPERASNSVGSIHQQGITFARGPSFNREAGIRVVPIRTVVAAVPASGSRPASNSSGTPVGLFYPLLARVQHMAATTGQSGQASGAGDHQIPNVTRPDATGQNQQNGQTRNDQEQPSQTDQLPAESTNTEGGASTGPRLGLGEGMFLSRLLHQIIPMISQNSDPEASNGSNGGHASEDANSHHVSELTADEPSVGSSHPRDDCAPPSPSSKRQKRE